MKTALEAGFCDRESTAVRLASSQNTLVKISQPLNAYNDAQHLYYRVDTAGLFQRLGNTGGVADRVEQVYGHGRVPESIEKLKESIRTLCADIVLDQTWLGAGPCRCIFPLEPFQDR